MDVLSLDLSLSAIILIDSSMGSPEHICFYASARHIDGARGIMFSGCPSVCVCPG